MVISKGWRGENESMLIAGDIGGTKTLLGLYHPEKGPRQPIAKAEFRSGDFSNLEEIVHKFLV
jgi:glucokinase